MKTIKIAPDANEVFVEYVVSGEWRKCDEWMKETGRY